MHPSPRHSHRTAAAFRPCTLDHKALKCSEFGSEQSGEETAINPQWMGRTRADSIRPRQCFWLCFPRLPGCCAPHQCPCPSGQRWDGDRGPRRGPAACQGGLGQKVTLRGWAGDTPRLATPRGWAGDPVRLVTPQGWAGDTTRLVTPRGSPLRGQGGVGRGAQHPYGGTSDLRSQRNALWGTGANVTPPWGTLRARGPRWGHSPCAALPVAPCQGGSGQPDERQTRQREEPGRPRTLLTRPPGLTTPS